MALMTDYWFRTKRPDPRSLDARDFDEIIDASMDDEEDPEESLLQEALALFDYVLARREQRSDVPSTDLSARFSHIQSLYGYSIIHTWASSYGG